MHNRVMIERVANGFVVKISSPEIIYVAESTEVLLAVVKDWAQPPDNPEDGKEA